VQGVGLPGQAAVPRQEPGEREPFGVGEGGLDRRDRKSVAEEKEQGCRGEAGPQGVGAEQPGGGADEAVLGVDGHAPKDIAPGHAPQRSGFPGFPAVWKMATRNDSPIVSGTNRKWKTVVIPNCQRANSRADTCSPVGWAMR